MKQIFLLKKNTITKLNGQVIDNQTTQIQVEKNDLIEIFPQEQNFLPFCFIVGTFSSFIKETTFDDFSMLSIENMPLVFSGEVFKHKNFNSTEITVLGKPFKTLIVMDNKEYSYNINYSINNIHIINKPNFIAIQAQTYDEDYFLIFHKNTRKFYEYCGEVDLSDNKLVGVINCHTLSKHGKMFEYEITDKDIDFVSSETVYLLNKPNIVPPFLSHIAFFEAIKMKDFNLASTFLAPDLKNSLTLEHLEKFFPEFDNIMPLSKNNCLKIALIKNSSKNSATGKTFKISFSEGKISNIEED